MLRRSSASPDLKAALTPGERLLASASTSGGGQIGSTTARLLIVEPGGAQLGVAPFEVPWEQVQLAEYSPEQVLSVTYARPRERPQTLRLTLEEPGRLPETLRERVSSSILVDEELAVPGGNARVIARRAPGTDGPVAWTVRFDAGLNPADPVLRAAADQQLAAIRERCGL